MAQQVSEAEYWIIYKTIAQKVCMAGRLFIDISGQTRIIAARVTLVPTSPNHWVHAHSWLTNWHRTVFTLFSHRNKHCKQLYKEHGTWGASRLALCHEEAVGDVGQIILTLQEP